MIWAIAKPILRPYVCRCRPTEGCLVKLIDMRTNKLISLALLALIAASCSIKEDRSLCIAPVTVHLNRFTVSQQDYPDTRTTQDLADYNGVNAITLAFYLADGTEQYKSTQLKSDGTTYSTFGEFSLSLPMGSYTMVAVAYTTKEESPFTLTSPVSASYTGAHAYETFVTTQAVDINSTDAVDIGATLSRIISQLKVVSTDGKTANVTNVRMTFSAGGRSFNPTTGLATSNAGFENTVGNSAEVGAHSTSSTVFFLATDEQTMDVTIETLDADGNTLFSKTVNDVPFKRNRITCLTGAMYTNTGIGGSFLVSTDWLTQYNGSF